MSSSPIKVPHTSSTEASGTKSCRENYIDRTLKLTLRWEGRLTGATSEGIPATAKEHIEQIFWTHLTLKCLSSAAERISRKVWRT